MSTHTRPQTAIIYQFPLRPTDVRSIAPTPSPWLEIAPPEHVAPRLESTRQLDSTRHVDFMSSWYHEDAIRETDRSRNH